MPVKNSYFPNEDYCFGDEHNDNLPVFVEMLKMRGCYIASDGHIRSPKGCMKSKLLRNGYYMTAAQYDRKIYYFLEHRVVWCWHNGAIPKGMEINHKDYNKANNRIENLELVTRQENIDYSRPNLKPCRGELSPRASFKDNEARAIKTVLSLCGLKVNDIAAIANVNSITVSRIKNGRRYTNAEPFDSILEAYPYFVNFTRNKNLTPIEELKDYVLGLNGEVGELTDLIKKILYHGKEYDPTEVLLELGDILYYLTAIMLVLDIDAGEMLLNNNAKLLARYPNGFSKKDSVNRIEDNR